MSIFKPKKNQNSPSNNAVLSELALRYIHDGVIIADKNNTVCFINPAAVIMTGCSSAENAIGLDFGLIIKIESKEGRALAENENHLIQAMLTNQPLDAFQALLINASSEKRVPVSISVIPVEGAGNNRIITLRNITRELAEESEQAEFISTASHEMRTPVATIDGYLSLTLNPQTATIDERARGYLTAAEKASKHLGKLFQDLLDVTKLDDSKIRPNLEPVEMTELIKSITEDYRLRAEEAKLKLTFGSSEGDFTDVNRKMHPVVYGFIDINFMREIMDNLIENAIKYTPEGGSIYVNVRADGDRFLVNVTDTGIGISADDLMHVFQKFYRADNSDTRTIGGTGLGLYIVKQRTEAMGGKVWAESAFGEGSTFYVSLPRLSDSEYEKRMIMVQNRMMQAPTPAVSAAPIPPAQIVQSASPVQPAPPAPPIPPTQTVTMSTNQTNNNLNGEPK
ncbi:PAS domain-containing sensor histidine kinase [Candidatus Saccharibacteria bacterium]|nr:PAS domain-containing sensor histidine kinase [Candidatus Saccharibacteria bacterium]